MDEPVFTNCGAASRSAFVIPRRTIRSGLRSPAVCVPDVLGVEPVTVEPAPPERLVSDMLDVVPLTLGKPVVEPLADGAVEPPGAVGEPILDAESDVVRGAVPVALGEVLVEVLVEVRVGLAWPSVTNSKALKGMATSFWPMPRNPPTPTTSATISPSRDNRMSLMSPTLSLLAA